MISCPVPAAAGRTTARWVAVVAGTAVLSGTAVWMLTPRSPPTQSALWSVSRLAVSPPAGVPLAVDNSRVAVSPDGRAVAYVAGRGRLARSTCAISISSTACRSLAPKVDAARSFRRTANGSGSRRRRTEKVLRRGGSPLTISDAAGMYSTSRSRDGRPTTPSSSRRLSVRGSFACPQLAARQRGDDVGEGKAAIVGRSSCPAARRCYSASPVLETLRSTSSRSRPASATLLQRRRAGLSSHGSSGLFQAGTLMAVPFDPVRLEVTGPVVVLSGVMEMPALRNSAVPSFPHVSFSTGGALAYVPAVQPRQNSLIWVDRAGDEMPTGATGGDLLPAAYLSGRWRVAVTVRGPDGMTCLATT